MSYLIRLLAFLFLLSPQNVMGAKTDSTIAKLSARIVSLERRVSQAKADSVEVLRLQDQVVALEKRVDYVTTGTDRAINVSWAVFGVIATLGAGVVIVNMIVNFRTVRTEVQKGLGVLKDFIEKKTDERVKAIVDPEIEYLKRYDRHLQLKVFQTSIGLLEKELKIGSGLWFMKDDFDTLLDLLQLIKDYEATFPEISGYNTDAFNAMVKYLTEKKIILDRQKALLLVLDGMDPKHTIHIEAIKKAIQIEPSIF